MPPPLSLREALPLAIAATREAGELLRAEFHRPGGPRGGGGHAEVDIEAEQLIRSHLLPASDWNYRGEETGVESRGHPEWTWLVDPNDGTSAYLKGFRGSAVSVAALRAGVPVLGVVYAFGYPDDEGDLIAWAEGESLTRNGVPLTTYREDNGLSGNSSRPAIVFLSQAADRAAPQNAELVHPARFIASPSIAYRLARVAAGDGVAAVSLAGPTGWDVAAGHALLRAVGGTLIDESGKEVRYTTDGGTRTHWCFGGDRSAVAELRQRQWHSVTAPKAPTRTDYGLIWPKKGHAVRDTGMLARAQGCLLGQLAGDALGGLVEFLGPEEIRRRYPHGVRELHDGGTWNNLAGQPTDDSELALMLARSLVAAGHYDSVRALDAYLHWWPRAWDRGATISRALGSVAPGATAEQRLAAVQQHASGESQANGSLMRISPLGIFGVGRGAHAIEWARADSRLTHPNPACQAACGVMVAALAHAIERGDGPEGCYEAALSAAADRDCPAAVGEWLELARREPPGTYTQQMGWVRIALQNAFYQLLHAPNVEEGLGDTIARGGDTDTNAAIAGSLLGAVHGRSAIPPRWILALLSCRPLPGSGTSHPQLPEFWPVDALILAESLLRHARGWNLA